MDLADKGRAPAVVICGDSVFRDEQISFKICGNPADNMFERLWIELIFHLGQLGSLRCGKRALRSGQGACIILHAEKIIFPDAGEIMGKLVGPFFFGVCLPAFDGLNIVQA